MTLNSVRNPVDSATQVYQVTGVVTDPATGEVYFSPTEEQADQAGFFYYDVQMTDSYGAITTLMKDVYFYSESITK
jgi:flagellar basal body rod protein FlgC